MAVQSRARQYVPPTSLGSEFIEPKTSRPVSQSWNSMRRSAVSISKEEKAQLLSVFSWYLKFFTVYKIWEQVEICSHGVIIHKIYIYIPYDRVFSLCYSIPNTPPTKEDLLCVGKKKWWVIKLPPASSHIPCSTESHSRSVENFYWCKG